MGNRRGAWKHREPEELVKLGLELCVPVVLAIAFLWHVGTAVSFQVGSVPALGIVTSCTKISNMGGDICNPSVSFQTQAGQQITFNADGITSYSVGETVTVRYHPDTPEDARLDVEGFLLWELTVVIVGCVAIVFGVRFFTRRREKKGGWKRVKGG